MHSYRHRTAHAGTGTPEAPRRYRAALIGCGRMGAFIDNEVTSPHAYSHAAGYLAWRIRSGDTISQALEGALDDLDGFYTFAIGVADGFAILRDPIACKPAVVAETDDWVAMSSEYRAIARLPGAADAEVWEPEPARIYTWSLAA